MKRLFPLLLLLFCACGCTLRAPARTPSPSPMPTPSPSPTPVPVVAVAVSEADEAFYEGFQRGTDATGEEIRTVDADALEDLAFPGRGVLVAALAGDSPDFEAYFALMERGIPVLLIAAEGQSVPDGIPYVGYLPDGAAALALNAAIAHPPHDTPVRMLGLFASKDADAYGVWQEAVKSGRVLRKGVFTGSVEDAGAWMQKQLKAFYPGMLDCVYAETPALALAARTAVLAAGRSEPEIFTAGADGALLFAMRDDPALLPMAAGWNPVRAGRLAREMAARLLTYDIPENVLLTPRAFDAETLSEGWRALSLP